MNPAIMQRVLKFGDTVHVAYAGGGGRVMRRMAKVLTVHKGFADVRFFDDGDEKRIEYRNIEIGEDIAARAPKKREPVVEKKPVRKGLHLVEPVDARPAEPPVAAAVEESKEEEETSMPKVVISSPAPGVIPLASVTASPANVRSSALAAWLDMGREVEAELDRELTAVRDELTQLYAQREALDLRVDALAAQQRELLDEKKRVAAVVRRV